MGTHGNMEGSGNILFAVSVIKHLTGCPERLWSLCFRGIQKLSGHGLGHHVVGGPDWVGMLDQITSRGPFQHQPYYDSVKTVFL